MTTGEDAGTAPGTGTGPAPWGYQVPASGGAAPGAPPGGWDWGPPPQWGPPGSGPPGSGGAGSGSAASGGAGAEGGGAAEPVPQPGAPPGDPSASGGPPPSLWVRFRHNFDEAPVTVSIVVVTVAVWLVHLALQRWAGINTDLTLGDNGNGIHGQWWRLVTPMVVHFGTLHIGANMFMLWVLGPPIEKVIGRRLYFLSYVACGVAGGILSDLVYGHTALSGGASGAIVGIVGVLIGNTTVTHHLDRIGRKSTQAWQFNPEVAKSFAVLFVIWIAFSSIGGGHVDTWAHLGGGVAGLVIGAAVARYRSTPTPA